MSLEFSPDVNPLVAALLLRSSVLQQLNLETNSGAARVGQSLIANRH